jgi:valyl-tRNA synthetase
MIVAGDVSAAIPLEGVIDMDAERKRLAKSIAGHESDIAKMVAKLSNPDFMARAKPDAIEEAEARKAELDSLVAKLKGALTRIEA